MSIKFSKVTALIFSMLLLTNIAVSACTTAPSCGSGMTALGMTCSGSGSDACCDSWQCVDSGM